MITAAARERKRWITDAMIHKSDECLLWPYAKTSAGYGVFYAGGKQYLVHRHLCEAVYGAAPAGKIDAAHSCGNGHLGCANPRHLRWASRAENMRDCLLHGTMCHGEKNYRAKLTDEKVREIRASSENHTRLAERYGVSESLIRSVRKRKSWAHV